MSFFDESRVKSFLQVRFYLSIRNTHSFCQESSLRGNIQHLHLKITTCTTSVLSLHFLWITWTFFFTNTAEDRWRVKGKLVRTDSENTGAACSNTANISTSFPGWGHGEVSCSTEPLPVHCRESVHVTCRHGWWKPAKQLTCNTWWSVCIRKYEIKAKDMKQAGTF